MYTSKQSFKYLDHIFELDMIKRGLKLNGEIISRYNKPQVGPYTSADDFFKFYWDSELDNETIKADNEVELHYINQGLNKTVELSDDKYEVIITFTTESEQLHKDYHFRDMNAETKRVNNYLQEYFEQKDIIAPTQIANI